MNIQFDNRKATSNLRKHGVSFEEAATALLDTNALVSEDGDAEGEQRLVLLGLSSQGRLLTVCYTLRGEAIRLISARPSTTKEVSYYA